MKVTLCGGELNGQVIKLHKLVPYVDIQKNQPDSEGAVTIFRYEMVRLARNQGWRLMYAGSRKVDTNPLQSIANPNSIHV